jgi:hypothetical protein
LIEHFTTDENVIYVKDKSLPNDNKIFTCGNVEKKKEEEPISNRNIFCSELEIKTKNLFIDYHFCNYCGGVGIKKGEVKNNEVSHRCLGKNPMFVEIKKSMLDDNSPGISDLKRTVQESENSFLLVLPNLLGCGRCGKLYLNHNILSHVVSCDSNDGDSGGEGDDIEKKKKCDHSCELYRLITASDLKSNKCIIFEKEDKNINNKEEKKKKEGKKKRLIIVEKEKKKEEKGEEEENENLLDEKYKYWLCKKCLCVVIKKKHMKEEMIKKKYMKEEEMNGMFVLCIK